MTGLDQHGERLGGTDQVLLAHHLVERAGPHPGRQRRFGHAQEATSA